MQLMFAGQKSVQLVAALDNYKIHKRNPKYNYGSSDIGLLMGEIHRHQCMHNRGVISGQKRYSYCLVGLNN
jgi:muramoyltetrapeptide carboxypeptidase LdcA involved in peptidoglycan recycling